VNHKLSKETFEKLVQWSKDNYSNLPWRQKRTAYKTLVSEIMLQQTTVEAVVPKFTSFIEKYPDILSLASANEDEIKREWSGLGYYRRAKNLLVTAKMILENHKGDVPVKQEKLIALKGIGPYTSSAIQSIYNNEDLLAVDSNVERILSRIFLLDEKLPRLKKEIQAKFKPSQFVEKDYGAFNEALMDLGRTVCRAENPKCKECLIASECQLFKNKISPQLYPKRTRAKDKNRESLHLVRFLIFHDGSFYVRKRQEGKWLEGQYELPTAILSSTDQSLTQYRWVEDEGISTSALYSFSTTITKYKIDNSVVVVSSEDFKEKYPFSMDDYLVYQQEWPLSVASQKALNIFIDKHIP